MQECVAYSFSVLKGTTIYLPKDVAQWLKEEAHRRGMEVPDYIRQITAMPLGYQPTRRKPKMGRPRGSSSEYRRFVRESVLAILARLGGSAKAGEALRELRKTAGAHVPRLWLEPYGWYGSRLELFAAWERKNLLRGGLLSPSKRGTWSLSPKGVAEGRRLLNRGGAVPPNL